jgi:two-component system phosphate regulon response regulator PhoB
MSTYLPPKIMIIDSDVVGCTYLGNSLERNGFSVMPCHYGADALKHLEQLPLKRKPNLIVIDDDIEDISHIELYRTITEKKLSMAPVILMLKDGSDTSIINTESPEILADYVVKPITQYDFMSKVKALLSKSNPVLQEKILSFRDIQINIASYKVKRGSRELHLGPTEFKLLQCLIEAPYKIFSRKELADYVLLDKQNIELRTIDVHINRLRNALKNPWDDRPVIKTIRAAGYCLNEN